MNGVFQPEHLTPLLYSAFKPAQRLALSSAIDHAVERGLTCERGRVAWTGRPN
jgi:hypothetical protein